MAGSSTTLQRLIVIGLGWAIIWAVMWIAAGTIIGILQPGSIDPGESPSSWAP